MRRTQPPLLQKSIIPTFQKQLNHNNNLPHNLTQTTYGDSTTSKDEELIGNEKEILTDTFQDFIPYNPNFVNCVIDTTLGQASMSLTDLLNTIENDVEKISEYWQTFGPDCLSFLTEEEFKLLNSPLTDASGNPLTQEAEEPGRIQFSANDDIGTTLRGTFMQGDSSPNYVFAANAGQFHLN